MQSDALREQIRKAIVAGAGSHRIAFRIVEWCKANCPQVARLAATSQTMAVLKLSQPQAEALVSEFLV